MKGASQIAPLGVRIPDDLKEKIQAQAKDNGRSTNAEIVQILENSFTVDPGIPEKIINDLISQYEATIKLKDEIIELQKSTMSHMESSISSLESHVKILNDHIDMLKKNIAVLEEKSG
jgi:plasmid stability protein